MPQSRITPLFQFHPHAPCCAPPAESHQASGGPPSSMRAARSVHEVADDALIRMQLLQPQRVLAPAVPAPALPIPILTPPPALPGACIRPLLLQLLTLLLLVAAQCPRALPQLHPLGRERGQRHARQAAAQRPLACAAPGAPLAAAQPHAAAAAAAAPRVHGRSRLQRRLRKKQRRRLAAHAAGARGAAVADEGEGRVWAAPSSGTPSRRRLCACVACTEGVQPPKGWPC